jgi:hypothetical protein
MTTTQLQRERHRRRHKIVQFEESSRNGDGPPSGPLGKLLDLLAADGGRSGRP